MRKLELNELRVETFATVLAPPVVMNRGEFTEQQYCTVGNPPANELDQASRTTCPMCCV
jgi:hypothetical protein